VSRATKFLERSIGQLCYDFLENANYLFLKIGVKLSGRRTITIETYTKCQKCKRKKNCVKELDGLYQVQNGDVEIWRNPLLWVTFWGFLEFSEERGPHMEI
jgi:hypothetical protein